VTRLEIEKLNNDEPFKAVRKCAEMDSRISRQVVCLPGRPERGSGVGTVTAPGDGRRRNIFRVTVKRVSPKVFAVQEDRGIKK